ncbi:MAG TPA: tripartite tricarboxylate transporter TctB family protein [Thermodesulfobacteriota bacterium]
MVGSLVGPVLLVAAAALLWVAAGDIPIVPVPGQLGPDFWPRLGVAGLAVLSGVKIVQVVRGRGRREAAGGNGGRADGEAVDRRRVTLAVVLLFAYTALLPVAGFVLATPIFLALFMRVGRYRRPATVGLSAVAATLVLLYLFVKVVYVPLPRGQGPLLDATVWIYHRLGLF